MDSPFLGEIEIFPYGYAPRGWTLCDGSSLPIQQNMTLYSLLGVKFGGNGTNFNLPNLTGAAPIANYTAYYIATVGTYPQQN